MSRYKRYERYQDSGVEWIGEIPEGWKVTPLKTVFKIVNGGTPSSSEENYWNGEIVWITPNDLSKLTEVYIRNSERKITEDGLCNCSAKKVPMSSIIISTRAPIGYVAIADVDLCTNQGCKSLVPTKVINHEYFYYWIYSISFYLNALGQGTTFMELSNSSLSMVELLIPSMNEQKAIANFLYEKTSEIDTLIAKKEKLIELLQEKRQAIITEAVTKGLNPNVRMKDSGIGWIGDIPEHWEIKKIKYLTSYIGSGKTPRGGSEIYTQEGVIFIRSQNVYPRGLRLDDVVFVSEEIDLEMRNTRVRDNDVLLNITGASIGRASLVPFNIPKANVNQHVCIIRPVKSKVFPSLLHQIICSNFIQNQIQFYQNGTSREGLNFEQVANLVVVIPNSLEEQRTLVKYIEDKVLKIDNLISSISHQIQKLKKYRQSLISEAVTGKIDVRDYANNIKGVS